MPNVDARVRWPFIQSEKWELASRWGSGPRLHSAHYLYHVARGRLRHRTLLGLDEAGVGAVLFVPRGMRYWLEAGPSGCGLRVMRVRLGAFGLQVAADAEAWELLMSLTRFAHRNGPAMGLRKSEAERVAGCMDRVAMEEGGRGVGRLALMKAACMEAVVTLARGVAMPGIEGRARPAAGLARMIPVIEHIEHAYASDLSIEELARRAGLGRSQFHAAFRDCTGLTAVDYLTRVRVGEACRLLRDSDMGVLPIAGRCGFRSLSRFYEAFEAVVGESPGRWRRFGKDRWPGRAGR